MTTTTHSGRTAALLLAFFLLAACSPAADVRGEDVRTIGVIAPLTGVGVNIGRPYVDGMAQAVEELNARGGAGGRTIRLAVQDGRLDSAESALAAAALLTGEDPDAFSVLFGLPALAVAPILHEAGKPMLYEAYVRSPLQFPRVFKANYDALEGCRELAIEAKARGRYGKLALFMARTEYGELCAASVREVEPGVTELWYEFGQRDFRSLLERARKEGVDTLLTIAIDFEYVTLFQQLGDMGSPMNVICATAAECIFPDVEASADPAALEGTLAADFMAPDFQRSPFAAAYRAAHPDAGEVQTVYAAAGYDDGMMLARAASACPRGDSACVTDALAALSTTGSVLGATGFTDRVLQLPRHLYEYRDGGWQPLDE